MRLWKQISATACATLIQRFRLMALGFFLLFILAGILKPAPVMAIPLWYSVQGSDFSGYFEFDRDCTVCRMSGAYVITNDYRYTWDSRHMVYSVSLYSEEDALQEKHISFSTVPPLGYDGLPPKRHPELYFTATFQEGLNEGTFIARYFDQTEWRVSTGTVRVGVPEPSSMLLLAIGLLGLISYQWRHKRVILG